MKSQPGPAARYQHDHPPVRDFIAEHEKAMTIGQRVADRVAAMVGSWPFMIVQSLVLAAWIVMNGYIALRFHANPGSMKAWDPYPFILLNLVLSFQAAYTGPVVMMSQNRHSEKDRLMAKNDFEVNQKAEQEILVIMEHLVHQDKLIFDIVQRLEALCAQPHLQAVSAVVEPPAKGGVRGN